MAERRRADLRVLTGGASAVQAVPVDRRRVSAAGPAISPEEGFRNGLKAAVANAMVRQAESTLALHQDRGHRIRAYFAARRLKRLVGHPARRSAVGQRIITYIHLGVR